MRVEKANVYILLKAKVRKTKEGIIFAVILTCLLWNWEARELLVLPAQNEDRLLHRESSLIFVSGDIGFPGTKKTKGYMPLLLNAWQKWSVTAVLTLAVLSAAPQLCSTCRTGILPRWSRHQMFHGLCMCSFWNRRLTSCFLKSYELTRLVCFGLCLLISELCRHLANIAPGNTAWSPSVCHLVSWLGGCSFTKDGVEDST